MYCIGLSQGVAQNINLENLGKGGDNQLKVNGGFSANAVYNSVKAINMPPFSYFLAGNINFAYGNFNLPVSVNYSNRKFTYSQPFSFNYVTLRPTYKWASAEIGTCFMSFSPYSLSGHQFTGVGVTLNPQKWNANLMYGQLLRANEGNQADVLPTYARMGMGAKVAYHTDKYLIGVSFFNAEDKAKSLANLPASMLPLPRQNLVIGLEFSTTLFKLLELAGSYHSSAVNQDISQTTAEKSPQKSLSGLLLGNPADFKSYNSYQGSINFRFPKTTGLIGFEYQRVDPDYITLGGYYFVNDFENYTVRYTQSFWGGKINFMSNAGIQQDDIMKRNSSSQKRFVGMASLTATINERFNWALSFSNFTSYAYIRTAFDDIKRLNPFEQLDTLNYRQINQNLSASANYTFSKSETVQQQITANASWMESANKQGGIVRIGQQSGFVNADIMYVHQYLPQNRSIGIGINGSLNSIGAQNATSVGPLFNFQKGFLKNQLTTNTSLSYIYSNDSGFGIQSGALNVRGNAHYTINKKNSLSGNIGFTHVSGTGLETRRYVSFTIGYINRF
jgi:hypothetical protein